MKRLVLFVCLIFAFSFCGCETKNEEIYQVNIVETEYKDDFNEGERKIIKSVEDLNQFIDSSVDVQKLNKYNTSFFEKHYLIAFKTVKDESTQKINIDSYDIVDETITINISSKVDGEIYEKKSTCYFLEFDNKDIINVNTIKLIKNNSELLPIYTKINFVYGVRDKLITINYNSSIETEKLDFIQTDEFLGIYYDDQYSNEYKGEPINKDITIYIKVKDGSKYLFPEQFEQEIIDYLTCYSGISKDDVGILYYFGEYNGLHILMLKDDAGYPGDGGNHGTSKLYYYKDKNLKQLRIGLDRLIEQGYFTYEDYYEFRIISEKIFIEVYGKNGQK